MRLIGVIITILLFIVAARLCITGDQMWDEANIYPAPERLTYEKFATERPLRGWYRLDDGWIDAGEAAYGPAALHPENKAAAREAELLVRARDVYVPLHRSQKDQAAADIMVLTKDPDLLVAVRQLASGTASQVKAERAPRMVQGMVRQPGELPEPIREALGKSINTQTIIIEEYVAPSHKSAAVFLGSGGGIFLLLAAGWLIVWRTEKSRIVLPDDLLPYDDDDYEIVTDVQDSDLDSDGTSPTTDTPTEIETEVTTDSAISDSDSSFGELNSE
jgi:hypothetical protein